MSKLINITGHKFGRWTVLVRVDNDHASRTQYLCRCKCGTEKIVASRHLRSGKTESCGCYRLELHIKNAGYRLTHGMSTTTIYKKWQGMKNRCLNKKDKRFHEWGGRGITVCDEWVNSFETFYSDMDDPPSSMHSLDRIDNDGPYCKANCRWATPKEQANNRSNNI